MCVCMCVCVCVCASTYSADLFTILNRYHSDFSLKVLENIYILTYKPSTP